MTRNLVLVVIAIVSVVFLSQTNPATGHARISPELLKGKQARNVLITFASTPQNLPQGLSKEEKGILVWDHLSKQSTLRQKDVRKFLDEHHISYQNFCIVNMISTRLTPDQMLEVASSPDIQAIRPNSQIMIDAPVSTSHAQQRSSGTEWGLRQIKADSVWQMGIWGQGVIVGGEDTGYDWEHPAIHSKYRGMEADTVDHNYNWHDAIHEINPMHGDTIIKPSNNPCGLDSAVPCDDHGHGTHTMGTMVGHDGEDTIGVAPAAQWIACRNMERGYGTPATYIECLEWFLAPTDLEGNNPDPSMAPHVINNSWSCPPEEGCNPENFELLRAAIANLRAAGVVVVTSAGNSGPNCASVNRPPGMYDESFVIGATNVNDTIANFSARGPVLVDSSGRIKPDVVAPGVGVRSGWLNNNYIFANGTSMSAPHVAGTVALLISANPDLAGEVELIEEILESTAVPLATDQECADLSASDIPNHTYGYGRIDALAAVRMAMTITSTHQVLPRDIRIYPNPANEYINIDGEDSATYDHLMVANVAGQVLIQRKNGAFPVEVSLETVPAGVYFLVIQSGQHRSTARFVKL